MDDVKQDHEYLKSLTVLYVEDDEDTLWLYTQIFSDNAGRVITAKNGAEGLEAYRQHHPDIIITDIMMPVMDGLDMAREIRNNDKSVPIIILTAFQQNDYLMQSIDIGIDKYVMRPVINSQLIDALLSCAHHLMVEEKLKQAVVKLKQMQVQLIHQEKMASIGQLAAGVAHEINNPVGFIASNLSTLGKYRLKMMEYIQCMETALRECSGGELPRDVQQKRASLKIDHLFSDLDEMVHESIDGVDRIKSIVNDLKSFARNDDQRTTMIDLNQCIHSTLNIVRNEYKYVAELLLDLQDGLPPIRGNNHHLSQVIANLVVNAAQAIEGQGTITITTWRDVNHVLMSVSDTGKGIQPEHLHQIFEPFFTTKISGKGTGLGLSISCDIINKHNGELTVESTVGKGSTFKIRLPIPT